MTFAKFFSIRSLTFNLILHILQSCIYYYVKKQFHNFLTLFDTTIPKYKQFQTFSTYFPQIQRSKVIKIDRKIDCISKKNIQEHIQKTQTRKKAYTLFADWHHRHRVEKENREKKEHEKKTSKWHVSQLAEQMGQ